jgi:hypothetical protein
MPRLEAKKLIDYPNGKKRGAGITSEGKQLLAHIEATPT